LPAGAAGADGGAGADAAAGAVEVTDEFDRPAGESTAEGE
jgi:hypothetical protein